MSSNKAVLHYFDGRGKAEIIRLTLAATGVEVTLLLNFIYILFWFELIDANILKWEQVTYTERAQYEELLRSNILI